MNKTLALLILFLAAPEARRWDEKLQKCNLRIKQNVDIWSLSCVFSEVATWVNKGWSQLAEYRNRRIQEMEEMNHKREDGFHDGIKVLKTVEQSHRDIIDTCRANNDPITPEVVNHIVGDMLLFDEKARSEASPMYWKSRRIIGAANAKLGHAQSPALAATHDLHPRSINANGPLLKDPPNLPPDHHRHGSGGRVFGGSSHAYPDSHHETYEQGSSTTAHLTPLRPVPGQSGYSRGRSRGRASSYDHYNQRPEAHTILSDINNNQTGRVADDNEPSGDLGEVNHRAASNKALRGPNSHDHSSHALSHSTSNADREDPSWGNASRDTPYSVPSKSREDTSSADLAMNQTLNMSDGDLAAPENRKPAKQLPEMSVNEGIVLKKQRVQFPRQDLFTELHARDHVSEGYDPIQDRAKTRVRCFLLTMTNR